MLSIDLFNVIFITAFVGLFLETYYKYLQTLTLQILQTISVIFRTYNTLLWIVVYKSYQSCKKNLLSMIYWS